MSNGTLRVPAALADDPLEVSEALEIAGVLWDKGDRTEAIRWVRRAAEAAADAGHTSRLASLAGGAADLEQASRKEFQSQTRPAVRTMPPARPSTAPLRPTSPPVVPGSAPSARPSPAAISLPTPEEFVLLTSDALTPATPDAFTPVGPLVAPSRAPSLPPSRPSLTPATLSSPPPAVEAFRVPPPPAALAHGRVRVSVRTSARDPSLLVVRPLAEGQASPAGTREAFLVMPELDNENENDGHANGGAG